MERNTLNHKTTLRHTSLGLSFHEKREKIDKSRKEATSFHLASPFQNNTSSINLPMFNCCVHVKTSNSSTESHNELLC